MAYNNRPVRDFVGSYQIGKNVKLYERVRKRLNENAEGGHSTRIELGDKIVEVTPNYANENLNPGTATGAVIATLQYIGSTYIPINFLVGDTEITSVEQTEDGAIYDVNVDAIFQQEGRFKAMLESGQGAQSLITEDYEFEGSPDVYNKKPVQTTWQYTVKVKTDADGNPSA